MVVAAALKLGPLVFVRPGELRGAEWKEFDLDSEEPELAHPGRAYEDERATHRTSLEASEGDSDGAAYTRQRWTTRVSLAAIEQTAY